MVFLEKSDEQTMLIQEHHQPMRFLQAGPGGGPSESGIKPTSQGLKDEDINNDRKVGVPGNVKKAPIKQMRLLSGDVKNGGDKGQTSSGTTACRRSWSCSRPSRVTATRRSDQSIRPHMQMGLLSTRASEGAGGTRLDLHHPSC